MLGGPVGEPVLIELLQVSAAAVHDGRGILPERGRRRFPPEARWPLLQSMAELMSLLTRSITVSTLMRSAMWATNQTSVATQTKASRIADGERQVRNELAFARAAHGAQAPSARRRTFR